MATPAIVLGVLAIAFAAVVFVAIVVRQNRARRLRERNYFKQLDS
jgi:Cu/Ag efflux pump CusA